MRACFFMLFPLLFLVVSASVPAALVTYTEKVCHAGDANVTWTLGNTYYLNVDNNVDVAGCMLTIQPGAVVKFKTGGTTYLYVTNSGILVAKGTSAQKIIFTSRNDDSVGEIVAGSTGIPNKGDYFVAIVKSSSAVTTLDSNGFSDLNIGYAKTALNLVLINSVHDSIFHDNNGSTSVSGLTVSGNSPTSIYNNTFINNTGTTDGVAILIYLASGSGGPGVVHIFNNTFSNNSSVSSGGGAISLVTSASGTATANVYNNIFSNNSKRTGSGGAIKIWVDSTVSASINANIYNNLFTGNSGTNGGAIWTQGYWDGFPVNQCTVSVTANVYNNTFLDNNANSSGGAAIYNGRCSSNNLKNNIFTYSSGTAVVKEDNNGTIDSNFNAFYANDTNTLGYTEGPQSVYLGADPFLADGTDRNFLLNAYGLSNLQGRGNPAVGTNSFFTVRTMRADNKLDLNRSIGFHFDQNAPFVQVISPNDSNTLSGTQSVDFNVESGFGVAANITAALAYSSTSSGSGTSILSQALSAFVCSALPVASCSYVWDTAVVTDGNYFVRLAGTDLNGTGVDYSDVNFAISNDSTAPVTTVDYNNAWQNVDANVVLTCVDPSGCLLTQFRLDSDSSDVVLMGGWQTFDSNILVSSDGNWAIDFNSTDLVGNRETTNRVYVLIDKSLPTLSLTVTSVKTVGLSATLSFLGSSESGIKKYWISSDGGTTYSDNGTTETYSFSISSSVSLPHTRRVYIKAMNNADVNTAAQSVDVLFEPAGGGSTSESCGNNICEVDENASSCPLDCPNVCGDRACTHVENSFSCPFDCAVGCGNGICDVRESKQTCPRDCDPLGGQIPNVTVPSPTGNQTPVTVPLTPQNKACESDSDCGVSTACSIARCIRNQCYGGQLPEGEPCDIGSVCKQGVCTNVSQQLKPVSESDPILWVSIGVIILALGAIGYEYFKK